MKFAELNLTTAKATKESWGNPDVVITLNVDEDSKAFAGELVDDEVYQIVPFFGVRKFNPTEEEKDQDDWIVVSE